MAQEEIFKDVLLGEGSEDPRILRARALDQYLADVLRLLDNKETEKARSLITQLRTYISVLI